MTKKFLLPAFLIAFGCTASYAQLSGNVSVEGEYEPIVVETERINVFPQGSRYELPAVNLDYDFTGMVTDFNPGLLTMGVTGRKTAYPGFRRHGFVDLRLGSYLNSRLHAGSTLLADSVNCLEADLRFLSSTLWRTRNVPDTYTKPPRKRLYDGRFGLSYSRRFGYEGLLTADVAYRLGYFNYFGTTVPLDMLPAGVTSVDIPTQTFHNVSGGVSYSSSPSPVKGWHAGANVDFMTYRRFYGEFDGTGFPSQRGDREVLLKASLGKSFNFAEYNAVSVDFDGDFLFLPKRSPEVSDIFTPARRDYGVVSIKPSYRFVKNGLFLQGGVDMALSYDAMGSEPDKRFGMFHIAPDVAVRYGWSAGVGIFLEATGGVTPSTLMLREEFDRYQMPWILSTQPVFTPLDLRFGMSFGPFAGFTGAVSLRYASVHNAPVGGWYQEWLGTFLPASYLTVPSPEALADPYMQGVNLHGFGVGLNMRYALGTLLELEFDGNYTPQKGRRGIFNGFDRPRWILSTRAVCRPMKRLALEVGYGYRGVRNCYALVASESGLSLTGWRLPDITDLNAKVTFSLLKNLDIYCKGENLINRHVDLLPGLQSEGIVISGGFYLEF